MLEIVDLSDLASVLCARNFSLAPQGDLPIYQFPPIFAFLAIFEQKLAQKWPKNQNLKNLLQTFFNDL